MADLAVTAANVRPVYVDRCLIKARTLLVAATAGQTGYIDPTTGKVGLAAAATAGAQQTAGIILDAGAAGETVRVLEHGWVGGFDLSAKAYDSAVYQSNTAGALADAAGTKSVPVGRVDCLNDNARTKVLRVCPRPALPW